jgi:hypothetical protein
MPTLRTALLCLAVASPLAVAQSGSIDLLSFAMPDAKIVAGVHVDAAKNSAFGQHVLYQMQSDNQALQKFIQDTGVDPRTDVREVVFATDGTPGPSLHGLVAAHGTFSNAISILESGTGANGGTVTHLQGGVDLITIGQEQANVGGRSLCVALYIDGATAAAGDCDSVQAGIASATKPPASTGLLAKAQQIRAQQDIWFTSVLPLGQFASAVPSGVSPLLNSQLIQAIQQTSGGVKFVAASTSRGPTVQLSGDALMDTPANATSLGNVVNFFLGMIQMQGAKEPAAAPFLSLLGSVQTSVAGSTLSVSLTIDEMTLEQLFQQTHQQASIRR